MSGQPPQQDPLGERFIAIGMFLITASALVGAFTLAPVPLNLDGPSHVYNSMVMRHLAAGDPVFRTYFQFGSLLIPNWFASILSAAFWVPGLGARNVAILNLVMVVMSSASYCFLIRRMSKPSASLTRMLYVLTATAPLVVCVFLLMGFWAFLLSLDLSLVVLAVQASNSRWRRAWVAVLVLLAYWSHPVPILLVALVPVAGHLVRMWQDRVLGRELVSRSALLAMDLLPWFPPLLLAAGLHATLLAQNADKETTLKAQVLERLFSLLRYDVFNLLAPTSSITALFIVYLTLLGFGAAAAMRSEESWGRPLVLASAVLSFLYLVAPGGVGNGGYVPERIFWMAISLTGTAALSGSLSKDAVYLRACALCAMLIVVLFAAEYMLVSRRMAPSVQELHAAMSNVPPRSRVLLLGYLLTPHCSRWPALDVAKPERHWMMVDSASRELIVLNDYEPRTLHFPVQYRDLRFPAIASSSYEHIDGQEQAWEQSLESADPGTLVISWGIPSGRSECSDPAVEIPFLANLRRRYRLLSENAGQSRLQIWEKSPRLRPERDEQGPQHH